MDLHVKVFGKYITDIIMGAMYDDNYARWLINDSSNRWMIERYIESIKSPNSYYENVGELIDELTEEYSKCRN